MNFHVITLFPEMIGQLLQYGVLGRAIKQKLISVTCWNPRDFTHDERKTVDDRPYGGGPGMLMQVQPLADAIKAARQAAKQKAGGKPRVVYLSPAGQRLNQAKVKTVTEQGEQGQSIIFIAGRYEGVDERLIDEYVDEQWSIGDYVLSGGELAAAVVIDAMARMKPGVLGDSESAQQDSFMEGLLDCPHYTRPEEFEGRRVPQVLMGGDHKAIAHWRLKQALGTTWLRRPDLLETTQLDELQEKLLAEFQQEWDQEHEQSQVKTD